MLKGRHPLVRVFIPLFGCFLSGRIMACADEKDHILGAPGVEFELQRGENVEKTVECFECLDIVHCARGDARETRAVALDGRMIDIASIKQAENLVRKAEQIAG